ncbi:MAG: glycosyltransferase family 2 protein, partial [Spirochaetes bacterium]|nr:glycosyltransferase family 2 protein [Spirochaetota bacterium]
VYKETKEVKFEVIVLDNASIDHPVGDIKIKFPQIILLPSDINYGFAKGNNIAAEKAKGEYILLLNPDTIVLNKAIDKLFNFAKSNPDAGVYGGRTVYTDGSLNPSCYSKTTPWSLFCSISGLTKFFKNSTFFNPEPYGSWKYNTTRQVDIVSGCFLLIKHDLWKKLNGFNPLFFMYAEEADLCLRAAKAGFNPVFYHESEIIHYRGVSEPTEAGKIIKTFRGEITLICEHWSKMFVNYGIFLFTARCALKYLYYMMLSTLNKKYLNRAAVWKEVWDQKSIWRKGWY